MRKFGWGSTVAVIAVTLAAAVPVNAGGYVLSATGPALVDVNTPFQVNVVLAGSGTHDAAIFNVAFSGPGSLTYNGYRWDPVAYNTGANPAYDDYSVPEGSADTGALNALITNSLYPSTPGTADVHFEALTKAGQTFSLGTLVTLTLTATQQGIYTVNTVPEDFVLFGDPVPGGTVAGTPLQISVVPEPATLVLLGLGGLAAARRRFFA